MKIMADYRQAARATDLPALTAAEVARLKQLKEYLQPQP